MAFPVCNVKMGRTVRQPLQVSNFFIRFFCYFTPQVWRQKSDWLYRCCNNLSKQDPNQGRGQPAPRICWKRYCQKTGLITNGWSWSCYYKILLNFSHFFPELLQVLLNCTIFLLNCFKSFLLTVFLRPYNNVDWTSCIKVYRTYWLQNVIRNLG